jgi:PKD domain
MAQLALAATACICLLACLASSAGAEVVTVGPIKVGLSPRVGAGTTPASSTYANPEGNPVLHGEGTYAIYWDPTDHYHGDWQYLIDNFFQAVGSASGSTNSVFAVDTQYTDRTNVPATYRATFHGAYTDTTPYPTSGCTDPAPLSAKDRIGAGGTSVCLTSAQIAAQIESYVAAHALPKGMASIYYLLTPPGVTVCLDAGGATGHCSDHEENEESYNHSFCSYHSDINPGGLATGDANTILYGVIPWVAGGFGDYHLTTGDQTSGIDCQDGGFDPSKEEKLEKPKERNTEEKEKFTEMDTEEKEAAEAGRAAEGPREQEPNQLPCPTTDGACDYGLADLITNQISLQQQDIVTDPLLNAWQDSGHDENTDECRFFFAPTLGGASSPLEQTKAGTLFNQEIGSGDYYLNAAFNLAAGRLPYPGVPCMLGLALNPLFTAPNTVNSGEIVSFNGMESDITLDAGINYPGGGTPGANYATYNWNFGDGTGAKGYAPGAPLCETPWLSPCAASVFHTYAYGGTYQVTLTATDVGGNVASVMHEVTVVGPPAPPAAAPAPASTNPTGNAAGSIFPVAEAAVLSRTLKSVLKKGLLVSYSVNEQVAGHFEVLISRAAARKLKLGGAPASGLPAGTPPELVIAKAVLVTTKAGHSTMAIKFSKAVIAKLKHASKASLMLRLTVRDAASKDPATSTVLSAVNLAG